MLSQGSIPKKISKKKKRKRKEKKKKVFNFVGTGQCRYITCV